LQNANFKSISFGSSAPFFILHFSLCNLHWPIAALAHHPPSQDKKKAP